MERLARELLLEHHALADVAAVEHDAAHVRLLAHVGHVRLDVPPLAEPVAHAEDDLAGLGPRAGRGQQRAVVDVHRLGEAPCEQFALLVADHVRDRLARVAAAAVAEHEHEVGRGAHEAAEVRRLAPRRGRQRERQEQRRRETGDAEQHLRQDQARDAVVGAFRDRARGVERDVRGQRGEHLEAPHGIPRGDPLVGGERHALERPAREPGAARGGEVVDEPLLLLQLQACQARGGRQRGRIVVAVDGRCRPAADEGRRAVVQQHRGRRGIRPVVALDEHDLAHVALGQRALPSGDLDDRGAVVRARGLADREPDADRGEEREGRDHGHDRASPARREWPERRRAAQPHATTSRVCIPPR